MKNAHTQSKPVSYLADSTVYIHKSVPDIYCMNTKAGHMYNIVSAPVITGFYIQYLWRDSGSFDFWKQCRFCKQRIVFLLVNRVKYCTVGIRVQ